MAEGTAEVVNLADFGAARQDVWRLGYRADDVELFQRRLISHGFTRLQPTGMVDLTTAAAVRVLQKHLGVPVDGVVSPDTRAALDADETTGGVRARSAGIEFSTPTNPQGFADVGDVAPAGQYLVPTATPPQVIQTIETVEQIPFYKNPMVWIGVGGAILVIYFLTRSEEGSVSDIGLEGMDGADDPEAFFAPPKPRRKPTRKPARAKPKPRKPRAKKSKGLADTALGPDGENAPDPHAESSDDDLDLDLPDEEAGVAGPPKPRRRKSRAAGSGKGKGKRNEKGQFEKKQK